MPLSARRKTRATAEKKGSDKEEQDSKDALDSKESKQEISISKSLSVDDDDDEQPLIRKKRKLFKDMDLFDEQYNSQDSVEPSVAQPSGLMTHVIPLVFDDDESPLNQAADVAIEDSVSQDNDAVMQEQEDKPKNVFKLHYSTDGGSEDVEEDLILTQNVYT